LALSVPFSVDCGDSQDSSVRAGARYLVCAYPRGCEIASHVLFVPVWSVGSSGF
jgi:hypothetical protein